MASDKLLLLVGVPENYRLGGPAFQRLPHAHPRVEVRIVHDLKAFHAQAHEADAVIGIESRGFIFGAPIARELGIGFVPVRKLGKLPAETISVEYDLEYGKNVLEIHRDALQKGARVVIVDDVLATGGTVAGTVKLVEQLGASVVGISFLAELPVLGGRKRLPDGIVSAIIAF